MFTEDIKTLQNKYTQNTNFLVSSTGKDSSEQFDLQYQLYAKYMQLSKQQIAVQQMVIIKDTQNLLQSLNLSVRLDLSKDVSSTMESFSYDEDLDNSISQEFSCIERRTPKKITRKGTRHSVLKPSGRSNDDFQQIINQIERNCTQHTLNVVKSLLQEHKKNMNKIVQIQKKQKNIRKIEQKSQKIEQENIIAKAKISEIEQKIRVKDDEIRALKEKLNQFKVTQKENMRSAQKMSVSSKCISEEQSTTTICSSQSNKNNFLTQYINTKEKSVLQRMTKIKQIETKIQSLIEDSVMKNRQQDCNKCCQMIKKIKSSVMNYRTYLEEESQESEKMYNMLKAEIENTLKSKDLPNLNLFHSLE